VYHAPEDRTIIGPPFIHLVNPDGTDVACTERWEGPSGEIDPTDPAAWPESNLVDGWHWCVDEREAAQLEHEERERLADLCDAPDAAWHRMMAESVPPVAGGSPEPDFEAWLASVDADYPPVDQAEDAMSFPEPAGPEDKKAAARAVAAWYAANRGG
jgi:hypothetical protein